MSKKSCIPTVPEKKLFYFNLPGFYMKSLIMVFLLIFATLSFAGDFQSSIKAVKSGKSKTAMAHWWGGNRNDSTMALQAAIDSGATKVIIKKMPYPWFTHPIKLRSNQEIILEDGVEIIAKKGAFKSILDCLFKAVRCKNLTIRGKNAKLIMRKSDYQDRTQYKKSEWRHGISLLSCENVLIEGITIKDTGGDAIYIGAAGTPKNYCHNIRIENVICDGNNRQGISVISVENLLIKDSKLINTSGTDPMAGIDFEPNHPNQRLVNCIVENCEIIANENSGINTYIKLDRRSAPDVSVTIKKCLIKSNKNGVEFIVPCGMYSVKAPVKGEIRFVDCVIEKSKEANVKFQNFRADGFEVVFDNCTFKTMSSFGTIDIVATPGISCPMGNMSFNNCIAIDKKRNPLIKFISNFTPGTKLDDIRGSIVFNKKTVDLAKYIKQNGWDKVTRDAVSQIELKKLKNLGDVKNNPIPSVKDKLIFRSSVGFLLSARKNEKASFALDYRMIRNKKQNMKVTLESPTGEKTVLKDAVVNQVNQYSFMPDRTNIYRVTCNPRGNTVNMKKSNVSYSIALPESGYLNLFNPKQKVYFDIPAGTSKLRILVSGQSSIETVDPLIKIRNKVVANVKKVSSPHLFDIAIKPSSRRTTGIIELNNAVEDVLIKILGPLQPIIAVNEKDLMILEFKAAP